MKKIFIYSLLLLLLGHLSAQKLATTEQGEKVVLYDNGTWKYEHEKSIPDIVIPMNPKSFVKDEKSSFLLKSAKLDYGFWLNPKKWTFKRGGSGSTSEYDIQLKGGDLHGKVLTENVEIPITKLRNIVIENAIEISPNTSIIKEEYRMVNGLKVLHLEMNSTVKGIKFTYYGYYYSSPVGTVQFIVYTSHKLSNHYEEDCQLLLNGLMEGTK